METLVLEPPKDIVKPKTVHRLQTIDSLMSWEIWKNDHAGSPLTQDYIDERYKYYKRMYAAMGYVGTGISYLDPAVFAVFNGGNIIAAGSVHTQTCYYPSYYLPAQSYYAYTTNALTETEFRGQGLNTQITCARIDWATHRNLPLVVTRVKPTKPASIQAKLKAGFVIDALADKYLTLLHPLNIEINQASGLHVITPPTGGENIALSNLDNCSFAMRYGVISPDTNPRDGLFVRMIPRDFGGAREI